MSRAMAWSSLPEALATVSVGESATPVTATSIVPIVVAVSEPSVEVAVTVSWKSAEESAGGVMVRPPS